MFSFIFENMCLYQRIKYNCILLNFDVKEKEKTYRQKQLNHFRNKTHSNKHCSALPWTRSVCRCDLVGNTSNRFKSILADCINVICITTKQSSLQHFDAICQS